MAPVKTAGRVTIQSAPRNSGPRRALSSAATPAPTISGAGTRSAHVASTAAATATLLNTHASPSSTAAAPRTGPSMTPAIAAAIAAPITWPRRSGGASPISQAKEEDHVQAPPSPCTKRADISSHVTSASPKTTLEAPNEERPISMPRRTPTRPTSMPAGIAPISVPAA